MNTVHLINTPSQVRQGDVLIAPVLRPVNDSDIGELVKDSNKARIVLAYGEVTGHAHAFYPAMDIQEGITKKVAKPVQLFELNHADYYSGSSLPEQRLLRLNTRALLRHEEHHTISMPSGDYVVIRQHEGDEIEEMRRVAD